MSFHLNTKAKPQRTFDAIVVGSGISGGWAAKELCEKGLKVLVLERGQNLQHGRDYSGAMNAPWSLPHRGWLTPELREQYPIQSKCYAFAEDNADFWVKDAAHPYIQEKPFNWLRGGRLGGRSLLWARQSYRWSDLDFEANARDGHGVGWPIRYADLVPWYDYVEEFAGVSGSADGIPQLPDGKFLPPMEMSCLEQHIAESMKKNWQDRRMIIGRTANLSQANSHHQELGRGKCQFRNRCHWGCPYGAYFSSVSATLPAAQRTGNLTIRTDAIVNSVIFDEQKQRATGVRIIDANTREMEEYFAKVIFLNASTLGTAFILLNSTSSRFPNGLGNDSGVIGHYLMDHHKQAGASATHEGFQDQYYAGRRPNGTYIPRFRNLPGQPAMKDFLRGYGFQGGASRQGWGRANGKPGFGESLKNEIREPGPWQMWLGGFGETLPHFDNHVSLDTSQTDQWGQPLLKADAQWRENERNMRPDIVQTASEILEAAGFKDIRPLDDLENNPPGHTNHEMGTCRMGRDPKTSALNGWNQMWAVKNIFVTDGACMTSSACQNPSLTYMALTARAADFAVRELKRGDI
jgi:choline dehydrogenase-like flavoprotein